MDDEYISETSFLYWFYDQIEKINKKGLENKISNAKQAKDKIRKISEIVDGFPMYYRFHFEQEIKDIKKDLKNPSRPIYEYISSFYELVKTLEKNSYL